MKSLIFAGLLSLLPFCSFAETQVSDGWIKQLPPSVPMRAGYMTITNSGPSDDSLLSVSSPAFKMVEMHESRMANGMMTMNELSEVSAPVGETVTFKPGGLHLMMMGIQEPLEIGDQVPVTLNFESGSQTLQLEVRK